MLRECRFPGVVAVSKLQLRPMAAESDLETLVTDAMVGRKGIWGSETVSPVIAESDIRRWAIAVYWPEEPPPIFWDSGYAATTRWGTIIAPPDFNPFAWPVQRARSSSRRSAASEPSPSRSSRGRRGMNGGQTDSYGVPMRSGDVIRARTRLRDWEERDTRLGQTLFTYTETEWRNPAEELVKRRVATGIRY
jgi:hypothetical protein